MNLTKYDLSLPKAWETSRSLEFSIFSFNASIIALKLFLTDVQFLTTIPTCITNYCNRYFFQS